MSYDIYDNVDTKGNPLTTGRCIINGVEQDASHDIDAQKLFSFQPYIEAESTTFPSGFEVLEIDGTPATYTYSTTTPTETTPPFSKCILVQSGHQIISDYIPVQAGDTLYGEIWAKRLTGATGTAGTLYGGIFRYDKDKKPIASNSAANYFIVSNYTIPSNSTWAKYSGSNTLPLTHTVYSGSDGGPVRYIKLIIYINYTAGTIPTYIGGLYLRSTSITHDTGPINVRGLLSNDGLSSGDAVVYSGASKILKSSSITLTKLNYLANVTAPIQGQLNDRVAGNDPRLTNPPTTSELGHVKASNRIPPASTQTGAIGTIANNEYALSDHIHPATVGMPWVLIGSNITFEPTMLVALSTDVSGYIDDGYAGLFELIVSASSDPYYQTHTFQCTIAINGKYSQFPVTTPDSIVTLLQFSSDNSVDRYGSWLIRCIQASTTSYGIGISCDRTTGPYYIHYRRVGGVSPPISQTKIITSTDGWYACYTPLTQQEISNDSVAITQPAGGYIYDNVRVKRINGGMATLTGNINLGNNGVIITTGTSGTVICTIPPGYRPYRPNRDIVVLNPASGYLNGGVWVEGASSLFINTSGQVRSMDTQFTQLYNITLYGITYWTGS